MKYKLEPGPRSGHVCRGCAFHGPYNPKLRGCCNIPEELRAVEKKTGENCYSPLDRIYVKDEDDPT